MDLIGFDPLRDFTIQPWISERLGRAMRSDDVILGAAHNLPLGSEITIFGKLFHVFARLGGTGAGTHERGYFMQSSSLLALAPAIRERTGEVPPMLDPGQGHGVSGRTRARGQRIADAVRSPVQALWHQGGCRRIVAHRIRQGLTALIAGALGLVALMFASTAVLVSILFSAIISERRSELGLLKAIGARRSQIVAE